MRAAVLHEIFLDLQKAYDKLDQDRCLEIVKVYCVGPRAIRILLMCWGRLAVVAKHGSYPPLPFKGYRGENQVDPLYPTIFNVVVNVVIYQRVAAADMAEEGAEGLGALVQDLAAYFYSENRLFISTQPERLQRALASSHTLFIQVSLQLNI